MGFWSQSLPDSSQEEQLVLPSAQSLECSIKNVIMICLHVVDNLCVTHKLLWVSCNLSFIRSHFITYKVTDEKRADSEYHINMCFNKQILKQIPGLSGILWITED